MSQGNVETLGVLVSGLYRYPRQSFDAHKGRPMTRCNECETWFDSPELRQPINHRTGHIRWDEDAMDCCPDCFMPLDGTELIGEPCEVCAYAAIVTGTTCGSPECQDSQ